MINILTKEFDWDNIYLYYKKMLYHYLRDRAEGGAGGGFSPSLFCKNKNKLNKK